jgi:orotidine-5'-phosphate decarboxylase
MGRFADRLHAEAERCGAPLCVGLDPFPDKIPAFFGPVGSLRAARNFCEALIERLVGRCACVKPQLGLFEAYGPDGYALAAQISQDAKALGLPVILDAKRGDIGTTASGYAYAALDPAGGFDADCVTVNPYMGLDTLEPFLARAETLGKGVAVLVRTSNPGARDFQDLPVNGAPLWEVVAHALQPATTRLTSEGATWSDLMIVVGATWPQEARRLRDILPRALFLVPGFGAQGASAADALAGLPGRKGGVINASRSICFPPSAANAASLAQWCAAVDEALRDTAAQLGKAG